MTWVALGVGILLGFTLGFKLHEVISRPVMDDYERLCLREARAKLDAARREGAR